MKVLHIIHEGRVGGGETHVLDLVKNLDRDEFTPIVITFTSGIFSERLRELGIKCYIIPCRSPFDISIWNHIRRIASEENIQIIHAQGSRACSNAFYAAKSLRIPLIYTIQSWSFHPSQFFVSRYLRMLCEKFLIHRADLNISISLSNHNAGIKMLRTPRSVLVPYGVNTSVFHHNKRKKLRREDFSIPEGHTLFGFIARLVNQKDPITLLKGMARAIQDEKNIHLLVVGDGSLKVKCREQVKELNIEGHVTFLPFIDDVAEALNLLDVYCLPSLWEGLPIGVLEAMAMKKAIIATPVDGVTEIIAHEVDGLLASVGCANSWKDAILKLHRNPALRKEFGERARLIVDAHHNVKNSIAKVGSLYTQMIQMPQTEKDRLIGELVNS